MHYLNIWVSLVQVLTESLSSSASVLLKAYIPANKHLAGEVKEEKKNGGRVTGYMLPIYSSYICQNS